MRRKYHFYIVALSVMLSVMLAGGILLQAVGQNPVSVTVSFDPRKYTVCEKPPKYWKATVDFKKVYYTGRDVDENAPILFEGLLRPAKIKKKVDLELQFDGKQMKDIIDQKVAHMKLEPGKHKVPFRVEGFFLDGERWCASGIIRVTC